MKISTGLGSSIDTNAILYGPAGAAYTGIKDITNGSDWDAFMQYVGWKDTPTITHPPSPAFGTPIAPQTEQAMKTWTPDQQAEAYAQKSDQYIADRGYFGSLLPGNNTAKSGNDAPPKDPPAKTDNTMLWVLGGVAAVLLFTTVVKR